MPVSETRKTVAPGYAGIRSQVLAQYLAALAAGDVAAELAAAVRAGLRQDRLGLSRHFS